MRPPQTHHDDTDTDADPPDDVQLVVEHLVDDGWTGLKEQEGGMFGSGIKYIL